MEIKELLEIMLDNVNQGREATHGLIGYNGVVSIDQPEQVFRKPHTYITFDEFREIRNCNNNNTALDRLNMVVDRLIEKRLAALTAPPVVLPCFIPDGYLWNESKGGKPDFYGKYCADGWTDERLIREGYLLQKPTREFFKPFIAWVCGGCNHVWSNPNYLFAESQFQFIKPSEARVKIVEEFNRARAMGKPFAGIVRKYYQPISPNGLNEMEELVNKRLNEIYQKL